MFFIVSTIGNDPTKSAVVSTIDLSLRIALIGLILVVGLASGLLLRRALIHRLKKNTALDNWLVQTLGILVVLPPFIIAVIIAPNIYNQSVDDLKQLWDFIISSFKPEEVRSILTNSTLTIFFIALGIGIARTARNLTVRGLESNRIDINMRTLIGRIFFILILCLTAFWILSLWNILKDLVAGFYILIERPFFIGNLISTSTYTGRVENVELRATKLRLTSGEEVTIPNSLVFGGIVVNNSYYGERRASITVTLAQEDFKKDETPERILSAIHEIEHVLEKPEPTVLFSSYTEQKITLTLRFWIATEQPSIVTDVMYTIHTVFPQADLAVIEPAGNI
jgi:small-conductance mechanosensitive channel